MLVLLVLDTVLVMAIEEDSVLVVASWLAGVDDEWTLE